LRHLITENNGSLALALYGTVRFINWSLVVLVLKVSLIQPCEHLDTEINVCLKQVFTEAD